MGDGLRTRLTGHGAQAPRAHHRRYLLALLAGFGCSVQLPIAKSLIEPEPDRDGNDAGPDSASDQITYRISH
jgi:hypothetical protein